MNCHNDLDKIIISNQIIKLIYKNLKIKKDNEKTLNYLKDKLTNILIGEDILKQKESIKPSKKIKNNLNESKPKETKIKKSRSKEDKMRNKGLDLKNYFECRDRCELDHRLNDNQLLELMDYYGLELINIREPVNRELCVEKLYSLILVLKEEQNKHKSLSFLYENNENNEINKLWKEKNLLYRNFEINTVLSKSLIYDNIYYIPSQDLFLTLNIRDKRKGKIQEIFVSGDKDFEIIKEEKIKLKNLYMMYTDLFELCELD